MTKRKKSVRRPHKLSFFKQIKNTHLVGHPPNFTSNTVKLSYNEHHGTDQICLSPEIVRTTVKLGYNDHGYNEFTLTTNKIMSHFWSQMTGYKDIFHGCNESQL